MAIDLSSIQRGKRLQAPRIFLYATHGIGKSTFGAMAPNPIFIQTEDGLGNIDTSSGQALTELERIEVSCKSCTHYEFRICQYCQAIPPEEVVIGEAPCAQWQHDGTPF